MLYSDLLSASLWVLTVYIALFWILVFALCLIYSGFDFSIFFTSYIPPRTPQGAAAERNARQLQESEEEKIIQEDLQNNVAISKLLKKGEVLPNVSETEQLLELGIALNQRLSQQDADNEVPGDHWLSYYRWAWFMLYQLIVGGMVIVVVSPFFPDPRLNARIGLVVSIVLGLYYGALLIREKHRGRITRFGAHVSFLHSGFQMRVPLIERSRGISLANMVWGPGGTHGEDEEDDEEEALDEFHLEGSTGDPSNPQPGVNTVTLHATYDLGTTTKIVLRVRRASHADWYRFSYEFANPTEIGETISDITRAVLTTRAREISKKSEVPGPGATDVQIKELIEKRLTTFIDSVPEITGQILLALYEVSRERLGGILPISVAITAVQPSESFKNLLLRLDTAQVDREASAIDGLGTAERWKNIADGTSVLAKKYGEEFVLNLLRSDMGLEVAQQQNPADQLWKAYIAPIVQKLGGPNPPKTKEKDKE